MADAAGIRAGRAYVELGVNDSRLQAGLTRAAGALKGYGASIASIGSRIAGFGAVIQTGIGLAVGQFTTLGTQLERMSERTGMSVESLSAFRYAAEQSGTNLEAFEGSLQALQAKLIGAAQGSKEAQDSFLMLGLSWRDLASLNATQQVQVLAEQISRLEHPARRAQAAMQVFGSTQILPMLAGGARGVRALTDEAGRLGLTMDSETTKGALALSQATNQLRMSFMAVATTIGAAVGPQLLETTKALLPIVTGTIKWVNANRPLVGGIALAATAIAGLGVGLVTLGGAISAAGMALGGLATGVGFVTALAAKMAVLAPVALKLAAVLAVVGAGVYGIARATGTWDTLKDRAAGAFAVVRDTGVSAWESVRRTASTAIEGISAAMRAGRWDLVWKISSAAIQLEWTKLTGWLEERWLAFRGWWAESTLSMQGVAANAWGGLSKLWVQTTSYLIGDWDSVTTVFSTMWQAAIGSASNTWDVLTKSISEGIKQQATLWNDLAVTLGKLAAPIKAAFKPILDFLMSPMGKKFLMTMPGAAPIAAVGAVGARVGQNLAEGKGLFGLGDPERNAAQRERRMKEIEDERQRKLADIEARRKAGQAQRGEEGFLSQLGFDSRKIELEQQLAESVRQAKEALDKTKVAPEVGARGQQAVAGLGASQKADVLGTFSGMVGFGLGGRTVTERIAAGVDGLKEVARDILNVVKNPPPQNIFG